MEYDWSLLPSKRAREILPRAIAMYDDGSTLREIQEEVGVSVKTISRWMDSVGYERRDPHAKGRDNPAYGSVQEKPYGDSRRCTECRETKSIEEFPERYDRPGRRRAKCEACWSTITKVRSFDYHTRTRDDRLEYRKKYQSEHPGYNRESTRRRSREALVRHATYSDADVRDRDQGLCWFCSKWVDPEIPYPDRMSQVIHHVHPISKYGPNVIENVALAHNYCNNAASNKYVPPFDGFSVRAISSKVARDHVEEHHYLRRKPTVSFAFGLFNEDQMIGVATFGPPSSYRVMESACPSNPKAVIEFNRLWIDDSAPFGSASWFVSRALKELPPRIVVSYADTSAEDTRYGTAHLGGVYRALSFHFAGTSQPKTDWRVPGSSRNVGRKHPGSEPHPVAPKNRFWTVTGSKKQRKTMRKLCAWPSLPYDTTKPPP